MIQRRSLRAAALVGATLVGASCGYTTSPALLPSHLKTIAVPAFENGTAEPALEREITDAVIARFVADNHLKVVDERSATAVLRGKVTLYRNAVFGFSTGRGAAQEYRVTVGTSVKLKDQVKNRELWSDNLVRTANYYVVDVPGQPARTELDGRKEAVAKIADEILSRTVQGW
ncbi:MAG TPA: LptE family protein [Candidatus Eisenbacteria bacterium]